jgi:hypothetical protein
LLVAAALSAVVGGILAVSGSVPDQRAPRPQRERVSLVDVFDARDPGVVAHRRVVLERSDQGAWTTVASVDLEGGAVLLDDAAVDRSGDGVPEVAVVDGNDGNCWSCDRVRLLQPRDGVLVDVLDAPHLDRHRWPVALRDVDGDGRVEVIVDDISWEDAIPSLCHACTPRPSAVVRFDTGRLVVDDAALRSSQLAEAEARRQDAIAADDAPDVLSAALALALLEKSGEQSSAHVDAEVDAEVAAANARARFRERLGPFAARLDPRDLQHVENRLWPAAPPAFPRSPR